MADDPKNKDTQLGGQTAAADFKSAGTPKAKKKSAFMPPDAAKSAYRDDPSKK